MFRALVNNKILNVILSISYILAIIALVAMFGFGFPIEYKLYINVFFIVLLFIGIFRTILKYVHFKEKIIPRVIIFDIISILFILYCIVVQITDYSWFFVSKYLQIAIVLKLIREIATPNLNFKRSVITPPQLFIFSFIILVF